jgi:hypothetical protein
MGRPLLARARRRGSGAARPLRCCTTPDKTSCLRTCGSFFCGGQANWFVLFFRQLTVAMHALGACTCRNLVQVQCFERGKRSCKRWAATYVKFPGTGSGSCTGSPGQGSGEQYQQQYFEPERGELYAVAMQIEDGSLCTG